MKSYTFAGGAPTLPRSLGAIDYLDSLEFIRRVVNKLLEINIEAPCPDAAFLKSEKCNEVGDIVFGGCYTIESVAEAWAASELTPTDASDAISSIVEIGDEFRRHVFYSSCMDVEIADRVGGHEFAALCADMLEIAKEIKACDKTFMGYIDAVSPIILDYVNAVHGENIAKIFKDYDDNLFAFVGGINVERIMYYTVKDNKPLYQIKIKTCKE